MSINYTKSSIPFKFISLLFNGVGGGGSVRRWHDSQPILAFAFMICCNRPGFDFQFRFLFEKTSITAFFALLSYFLRQEIFFFSWKYIAQLYNVIRCFCLVKNILLCSVCVPDPLEFEIASKRFMEVKYHWWC